MFMAIDDVHGRWWGLYRGDDGVVSMVIVALLIKVASGSGFVVAAEWLERCGAVDGGDRNATEENRRNHHAYDRLLRISIAEITTPKGL
ncbi:hypothetical protein Tco_0685528 [Tanacetum coccineum]